MFSSSLFQSVARKNGARVFEEEYPFVTNRHPLSPHRHRNNSRRTEKEEAEQVRRAQQRRDYPSSHFPGMTRTFAESPPMEDIFIFSLSLLPQHLTQEDLGDTGFVTAFKKSQEDEKSSMRKLREKNRDPEERAKNEKARTMIECELCYDLFHPSHVPLPKPVTESKAKSSNDSSAGGGTSPSSAGEDKAASSEKPSSLR